MPSIESIANPAPAVPPLLETTRALQCAVDPAAAKAALTELKKNRTANTNTPNEWFGEDREPALHAGTLDIVIDVILNSIEKHPVNTDLAESVLLGWNYCAVHHNGQYYDQSPIGGLASRRQAHYPPPTQWRGLQRLGIGKRSTERYIPIAFSRTDQLTRPQVVYDWWAIQRNQCLPHPATGELFYKKTLFGPSKVVARQPEKNNAFPHPWTTDCSAPYTEEEHRIHNLKLAAIKNRQQKETTDRRLRYIHASTHAKDVVIASLKNSKRKKAREELQRRAAAFAQRQRLEKEAAIEEANAIQKVEQALQLAQHQTQKEPPSKTTSQPLPVETDHTPEIAQVEFKPPARPPVITIISPPVGPPEVWDGPMVPEDTAGNFEAPNSTSNPNRPEAQATTPEVYYREEPVLASALDRTVQNTGKNLQSTPPQTNSTSFPSGSVPPFVDETPGFKDRKYHGFSGSFALSNQRFESSPDARSLTANFGYKPIRSSYFFARTGFAFTDTDTGEPVSYYWGIGYNDWHTDTWAFELNHWGPLRPGDGLQLEKAVASISYKFDSKLLTNNGISSSFSISGGKDVAPTATLAGSWTPKPNWFIRTLLTQPLEGGDMTWAYGFGYSDWREKTWAIEYNNWGPNKAFDLNFRDNAMVTLSWKWGF